MSPAAWSGTLLGQEHKLEALDGHEGLVAVRICRIADGVCYAIDPVEGMKKGQWKSALRTDHRLALLRSGLNGALLVTSLGLGGWLSWIGGLSQWLGGNLAFMGAGAVANGVGVSEVLVRDDLRVQAMVVLFHPINEVYWGFDDSEIIALAQYLSLAASVERDIRSFQLGEMHVP